MKDGKRIRHVFSAIVMIVVLVLVGCSSDSFDYGDTVAGETVIGIQQITPATGPPRFILPSLDTFSDGSGELSISPGHITGAISKTVER